MSTKTRTFSLVPYPHNHPQLTTYLVTTTYDLADLFLRPFLPYPSIVTANAEPHLLSRLSIWRCVSRSHIWEWPINCTYSLPTRVLVLLGGANSALPTSMFPWAGRDEDNLTVQYCVVLCKGGRVLALCCHARIGPESDFDNVACLEGRWDNLVSAVGERFKLSTLKTPRALKRCRIRVPLPPSIIIVRVYCAAVFVLPQQYIYRPFPPFPPLSLSPLHLPPSKPLYPYITALFTILLPSRCLPSSA